MYDLCQDTRAHVPSEICGFLLRNGGTWSVVKMINVAEGDLEFAMDATETINVFERWGRQIVGVYHSHPEATLAPSQTDIDYAPIGLRYWIVTPDAVTEWDMCNYATPFAVTTQTRSS